MNNVFSPSDFISFDHIPVAKKKKPTPQYIPPSTPADLEEADIIRNSFSIEKLEEKTIIYAVAVNEENLLENSQIVLRCYKGESLGGYAYDRRRDAYLISGTDHIELCHIPFSYSVKIDSTGFWRVKIPLPLQIIERNLTPPQREMLFCFKESRPEPKYKIQFVQMVGCT